MNFQDSSVQVISYWNLGDTYEYSVSLQKLQYTETDTTTNETITYDVEVSVIDSTENSYVVKWFYKNFKSDSPNPIVQKLAAVSENIAVNIKLDELGMIQSVENWEEVRDYMAKAIDLIKSEFGQIPGMDRVLQKLSGMYSTKESIEAGAIQDVLQFHNFHGGRYVLNEELRGQIQTPNLYYIDKPLDTDLMIRLEDLDKKNNQYVIRSIQAVNSEQLIESTYNFLKETSAAVIQKEDFLGIKNTAENVSRIHNTGWVLESVLWKEVVLQGVTSLEIRTILMK